MTITLTEALVYLVVAVISAYLAERLIGTRLPFGFVGAFVAALIGAWLMNSVLRIILIPELSFGGVPVVTAVVGSLIVAWIWGILSGQVRTRWTR